MRNLYSIPVIVLALCSTVLSAQTTYLDAQYGVSAPETMVYGENYNLAAGNTITPLPMDVYTPVGDTDSLLRPVVVFFHTGNFLPQYINGGPYGDRKDSVNVEMINRFVRKGFVGISADYRLGWQPTAESQTVRTETLLKAVYRASQDGHTMARYLRKTVVEDENPLRIDTSKIMFVGIGSGGYLVNAFNFLDNIDQIAKNLQFLDSDFNVLIDSTVLGNPQGTLAGTNNKVNHPGYNSKVALAANIAGALGDSLWIDGDESPIISIHSATDPFAPYYAGLVIVPTNPPRNVVNVQGSRLMVQLANEKGVNDILAPANASTLPTFFDPLSSVVNQIVAGYSLAPFTSPIPENTRDTFPLGVQNLWTVLRTSPPQVGTSGATTGIWNWFNEADLRTQVAAINTANTDANLSADAIIAGEIRTNPNYNNPTKAKSNIDTMMAFMMPRVYYALDLANLTTGTEEIITTTQVGLKVYPNPTTTGFTIEAAEAHQMRQLDVFDLTGRRVFQVRNIDRATYFLERGELPNGTYILQIRFDEGTTAQKVMLR